MREIRHADLLSMSPVVRTAGRKKIELPTDTLTGGLGPFRGLEAPFALSDKTIKFRNPKST
jgi:hypothetical protein